MRELVLVYALIAAITVAITKAPWPFVYAYQDLWVGLLFLIASLRLADRDGQTSIQHYGIHLGGLLAPSTESPSSRRDPLGLLDLKNALAKSIPSALRETAVALAVAAIVFPPFAVGFWLWNRPTHPFSRDLPSDLWSQMLSQLLVVALPEEFLFRGYFQTRLSDFFPQQTKIMGALLSIPAWIGQAALFAILHWIVDNQISRLAVFFPGLLFGWLRAWRGGVGASIVMHALSNIYATILVRGWL